MPFLKGIQFFNSELVILHDSLLFDDLSCPLVQGLNPEDLGFGVSLSRFVDKLRNILF